MASILTKILRGEIPSKLLHDDEICAAIRDINPQAPHHILVFPKVELRSVAEATAHDQALLGHLLLTAAKIARDEGFAEDGYRLVLNTGDLGGQTIPHLHVHLIGGRALGWPPG